VKPVFSNLLLRGGVVPPRNIEDSFGEVEKGCGSPGVSCNYYGAICCK